MLAAVTRHDRTSGENLHCAGALLYIGRCTCASSNGCCPAIWSQMALTQYKEFGYIWSDMHNLAELLTGIMARALVMERDAVNVLSEQPRRRYQ